jgi:P2-related tail formation protein
MNKTRLLPTGSSPLEVAAAQACAGIESTPIPLLSFAIVAPEESGSAQ